MGVAGVGGWIKWLMVVDGVVLLCYVFMWGYGLYIIEI